MGAALVLDLLLLALSAFIRSWRGVTRVVGMVALAAVPIALTGLIVLGLRAAPDFLRRVWGRDKAVVVLQTKDGRAIVGVLEAEKSPALVIICTTAADNRPGRRVFVPLENISAIESPAPEPNRARATCDDH